MDGSASIPRGAHAIFTAACIMRAYHIDQGTREKGRDHQCRLHPPLRPSSPVTAGFKMIILPLTRRLPRPAFKAAISEGRPASL